MPKLPAIKPRILIKRLKKAGFIEDHQSGSHVVMYHPKTGRRAIIPYHFRDIPKGTLNSLIKEAGISKEEIS
ncbi:MAG: type II toxin-antitoxin system HicA family toxin [Candidatus Woesebacteria bacterium]|nr:type II toxin-antitoxin system HicA family toxin [Candidatus Woesebacteria bacterium]